MVVKYLYSELKSNIIHAKYLWFILCITFHFIAHNASFIDMQNPVENGNRNFGIIEKNVGKQWNSSGIRIAFFPANKVYIRSFHRRLVLRLFLPSGIFFGGLIYRRGGCVAIADWKRTENEKYLKRESSLYTHTHVPCFFWNVLVRKLSQKVRHTERI